VSEGIGDSSAIHSRCARIATRISIRPSNRKRCREFISYRRDDSIAYAGRIWDRLRSQFGDANVVMDIDALEPGVDFVEGLERTVASCDAFLALRRLTAQPTRSKAASACFALMEGQSWMVS
jgi:hypothetical protein